MSCPDTLGLATKWISRTGLHKYTTIRPRRGKRSTRQTASQECITRPVATNVNKHTVASLHEIPAEPPQSSAIIPSAGESDDRRFASRKGSGREESPDSHGPQLARASDHSLWPSKAAGLRATRLVTPGGFAFVAKRSRGHGKCHRKLNRR